MISPPSSHGAFSSAAQPDIRFSVVKAAAGWTLPFFTEICDQIKKTMERNVSSYTSPHS